MQQNMCPDLIRVTANQSEGIYIVHTDRFASAPTTRVQRWTWKLQAHLRISWWLPQRVPPASSYSARAGSQAPGCRRTASWTGDLNSKEAGGATSPTAAHNGVEQMLAPACHTEMGLLLQP